MNICDHILVLLGTAQIFYPSHLWYWSISGPGPECEGQCRLRSPEGQLNHINLIKISLYYIYFSNWYKTLYIKIETWLHKESLQGRKLKLEMVRVRVKVMYDNIKIYFPYCIFILYEAYHIFHMSWGRSSWLSTFANPSHKTNLTSPHLCSHMSVYSKGNNSCLAYWQDIDHGNLTISNLNLEMMKLWNNIDKIVKYCHKSSILYH